MRNKKTIVTNKLLKKTFSEQEIISIYQLNKILMTLWLGGTWMSALIIFPVLFKSLDIFTVQNIITQILNIQAYLGVICLIIAFVEILINHKLSIFVTKKFWYIIVMLFILIINYFNIFPIIYKLQTQLASVAHEFVSLQKNPLDFWHSFHAISFIINCIVGVLYLIDM